MTGRSVWVDGLHHGPTPIPTAARVGNVIFSGGIMGVDPAGGGLPDSLVGQMKQMFANVRTVVEAAGGTIDDIGKFTVWVRDASSRDVLNESWLEMFPDEADRPARHLLVYDNLPGPVQVQCEFIAVVDGGR